MFDDVSIGGAKLPTVMLSVSGRREHDVDRGLFAEEHGHRGRFFGPNPLSVKATV